MKAILLILAVATAVNGCGLGPRDMRGRSVSHRATIPALTATILQINDVYEIMPLGGSGLGGLARVATLKKRLLREDPNTFMVLAGDVLSPSAMSSARAGDGGAALNGSTSSTL